MKRRFKFKNVVLFREGEFFERLILFAVIWTCVVGAVHLIANPASAAWYDWDAAGGAIFGPEAHPFNATGYLFVAMGYVALLFRPTPWPRMIRYLAGWFFLFHMMTAWSAGDLESGFLWYAALAWALYSLSAKRAVVVNGSASEERPESMASNGR